jgi:hypothetical protein
MADRHGGRRQGSGRPSGSAWKPRVSEMRADTVRKMHKLIAGENDPLSVLVNFSLDESLDVPTRMNAAAIALPYLFPKLSEMRIDSKTTVTTVDGTALMERIAEKIERMAASPPRMLEPVIEVVADDADADVGDRAGDEPPADG